MPHTNRNEAQKSWNDLLAEFKDTLEDAKSELTSIRNKRGSVTNALNNATKSQKDTASSIDRLSKSQAELDAEILKVKKTQTDSEKLFSKLDTSVKKVVENQETISKQTATVEELLDFTDKKVIGTEFLSYSKIYHKRAITAMILSVIAALVAVIGIILVLNKTGFFNGDEKAILDYILGSITKLLIFAPIIAIAAFSYKEYLKNTDLEKQYRFRAAILLSLKANSELLNEQLQAAKTNTAVPDFVRETIQDKIYSNPMEESSRTEESDGYTSKRALKKTIKDLYGLVDKLTDTLAKFTPGK